MLGDQFHSIGTFKGGAQRYGYRPQALAMNAGQETCALKPSLSNIACGITSLSGFGSCQPRWSHEVIDAA